MKQGRRMFLACAVLAALALAAPAHAAAKAPPRSAAPSTTRKPALRQFSGWVTAVDKSTITVEKRGKNARSVVFAKDAGMSSTGEIEKDARVTVYYREEDGRTVAHRVVAKPNGGKTAKAANP